MKFIFVLLFITFFQLGKSQTCLQDPFQNYGVLQHYTIQELSYIQQTDSSKFNTICYYYTQSFLFENVTCDCTPQTLATFDISAYEYMRKKDNRAVRIFEKYGFKLTLLSVNELVYKLPIHNSQ